jgi:hypothetical protein
MQEWALLGELSRHPVVAAAPVMIRPLCPDTMIFIGFSSSFANTEYHHSQGAMTKRYILDATCSQHTTPRNEAESGVSKTPVCRTGRRAPYAARCMGHTGLSLCLTAS